MIDEIINYFNKTKKSVFNDSSGTIHITYSCFTDLLVIYYMGVKQYEWQNGEIYNNMTNECIVRLKTLTNKWSKSYGTS